MRRLILAMLLVTIPAALDAEPDPYRWTSRYFGAPCTTETDRIEGTCDMPPLKIRKGM
jgi:hypothetical protein